MKTQTKLSIINNLRHIKAAVAAMEAEVYSDNPDQDKLWGKSAELAVLGKGLCNELNPDTTVHHPMQLTHG